MCSAGEPCWLLLLAIANSLYHMALLKETENIPAPLVVRKKTAHKILINRLMSGIIGPSLGHH